MVRRLKISDLLLATFLIVVTALLLVPLPTFALDLLLVINLALSLILLLAGLYLPNALALLAFPSILLLTTLLRLSLNVASTRLILGQGDAGQVIQSFGTFLVGDEIIVGVVIFLILTVVNFIVVARGSSRVSEVAARFALDALPGKQMAIEADVRAGLLSATDAQKRREDLRKESQLYGSMDGAMKFVQGDAIAGLFIIIVNIVGGMYLGIQGGMSLSEAVTTYTTLTVGDGLVHQIPAILISICAGIIVTRVSSGEGASLGSDVQAQLFARPGSIAFAGLMIVALGLTPGLPILPFVLVGGIAAAIGGVQLYRQSKTESLPGRGETSIVIADNAGMAALALEGRSGEPEKILHIYVSSGDLYRTFRTEQNQYRLWWQRLEADFFQETGLRLPPLRLSSDPALGYGSYRVVVRGTTVAEGQLIPDASLVEMSPHSAPEFGLSVVSETPHPLDDSAVTWSVLTDANRRVLEAASILSFDAVQYLGLRVVQFFRDYPEELLSVSEMMEIETALEKRYPGLLTRTFDRQFLSPARLTEIFQQLLREGESVRDSKQIIESLATYCSTAGAHLAAEGEFDLEDIVSFVRRTRRRHLISRYLSPRRTLRVLSLAEAACDIFGSAPMVAPNGMVALPPEQGDRLKSNLSHAVSNVRRSGTGGAVLLVDEAIRGRVVAFIRQVGLRLPVFTPAELEPAVPIEPLGVVGL